jgi:hypothetical protein
MGPRKKFSCQCVPGRNERRLGVALQLAQCPQLIPPKGVNGRLAVLRSTDVQRGIAAKFDLRPFEAANLDRPQAMPKVQAIRIMVASR